MSDLEPRISRPKATATWNADWYDGPTGSAIHHDQLEVSAYYSAMRPEASGAPNRIRIGHKDGDSSMKDITLNRVGAHKLLEMLNAALDWDDKEGDDDE